ncbi:MAG: PilZ domain-containing protein [Myxococcales bacterium]|nr:PilZ domain-containing protein [Myxococcales bacterium]
MKPSSARSRAPHASRRQGCGCRPSGRAGARPSSRRSPCGAASCRRWTASRWRWPSTSGTWTAARRSASSASSRAIRTRRWPTRCATSRSTSSARSARGRATGHHPLGSWSRGTISSAHARRTAIERRHQYRVTQSLERLIDAVLVVDDKHEIAAVLTDISAGGAGVSVSEPSLITVKEAKKLELRLVSPRLGAPILLPTSVRAHAIADGVAKLGLEFTHWAPTRDELDPQFRQLFNLREHFRVAVPLALGVTADLSQGDITVRTVLRDISMSGLGLDSDARVLDVFVDGSRVSLALQVPGGSRRTDTEVIIRHRDRFVGAKRIYVGVQLPPERAMAPDLRLTLQRLVMELQRRRGE